MIIAVDLDDVLADSLRAFIEFYNENYNKKLKYEDFTAYTLNEIMGMPREEENKILEKFDNGGYFEKIKPIEGAVEAIKKLSKKHKIIIITSRTKDKEEKTKKWVEKFFGKYDIYFIRQNYSGKSKTKAEICKEIKAEILIEDYLGYAENCAKNGIKVLLFDYPWNQKKDLGKLIKRIKSWEEIVSEIEAI